MIEFTVTLAPVAVSVPVALPLLPIVTLPIGSVVGETDSWPCVTVPVPVPVADAVRLEFEALLLNVRFAVADPVVVGVNVTVNGALCPAAIVVGSEIPVIVNAELSELTELTVTLPPVAVSVPAAVPLLPSATLPTASVPGETDSCPTASVPVPESTRLSV